MRRAPFPSALSAVLILQCLAPPDALSVTADYDSNSFDEISSLLSEQLGDLGAIANMKRSFDFHADADNVLSKARVKYASYENSEAYAGKPEDPSWYCYGMLDEYSKEVGALMGCVANNAGPLRVCTNCVHHVQRVNDTREELKHGKNQILGQKTCIDVLAHKDVLEVVEDVFETAVGEKSIWFKGGCSQCFEDVATGTQTNDTTKFFELHRTLEECFEEFAYDKQFNSSDYGRSKCCHACKKPFNDLIEKYHDIKDKRAKQRPGDFGKWPKMLTGCSDLDDIYNYTGSTMWRQEFLCYPRIQNRFMIAAMGIGFIVCISIAEFHPGCFPRCRCLLCWLFAQGAYADPFPGDNEKDDDSRADFHHQQNDEYPHLPGDRVRKGNRGKEGPRRRR